MAGLIDQLNAHSQGNVSLGDLGEVAGKLGTIVQTFRTLPDQPTAAIQALLEEIGDLPVPELRVASQVGSGLTRLADSMPGDFSSITGAFDGILENLENTVGGNVVPALRNFIDLVQAVEALGRFDLEEASKTPAAGPAGPGAPGTTGAGGSAGSGGSSGTGTGTGVGGSPAASPDPGGSGPGGGAGSPGSATVTPSPETVKAREGRLAALTAAREGLSVFPSPLNAPALVLFLEDILTRMPRDQAKVRKLPFFDEAQQLLHTIKNLRGMDESALAAHLLDSLQSVATFLDGAFAGYLDGFGAELQSAAEQAKIAGLRTDLGQLRGNLASVAEGVEAGTLSGKAPDIAAAAEAIARLRPMLEFLHAPASQDRLRYLAQRARRLPIDMERQMKQLLAIVEPANAFRFLSTLSGPLEDFLATDPSKQLAEDFKAALAMPMRLLDLIESSGLREVLETPTQAINTVLEQMDAVTGQVASGASGIFGEAGRILDEIDPEALLEELHQAIAAFRQAVEAKVAELFEPIVTAIRTALTALKTATDAFDPEAIVAALKKFLEDLAAIFEKPEVQQALDALHDGIGQATGFIQGLHFSPVTDAVEEGIQKVIDVLGMIEPALLPDEAKKLMQEAVSKLPADLDAPIGEITAKFDDIVDEGPRKLLKFLSEKAKEVKDALERFKPSELVGDDLSAPFRDIIAALEEFHPASLFDPVREALDGFRGELLERLDPTQVLAPLQPQFDTLKERMDSIDPQALLKPVEDAVKEGARRLREALPLDEIIAALSAVLDKLDHGFKVAAEFRQGLEKILEVLGSLGDSQQQLRTWIQPVLTRVENISDVSSLQPSIAAIAAAVNGCKAAPLTAGFETARKRMKDPLDLLAPAQTLEELVAMQRRFRPDRMSALAASPEKTALSALLEDFEPLQPAFSGPLQSLAALRTALNETGPDWSATMSRWDARHHRPGGPLARMAVPSATAAQLRDMLSATLESEFVVPVGGLFGVIDGATRLIRAPMGEIIAFLQSVETRAAALLTGPDTLGGLVTGLQGLADRISGFDIGFLTRELGELFDAIKEKVGVLDPSRLATELRDDLELALGVLSVDTLVPPDLLPELETLCQSVAAKLKLLDPKVIIEKTLEPVWNERIRPQVLRLDFSPLLDALLAKLDELKIELGDELGDVNEKYQALLAAIPSGSGSPSASASVEI